MSTIQHSGLPVSGPSIAFSRRPLVWLVALFVTVAFACVAVVVSGLAVRNAAQEMRSAVQEATMDLRSAARDIDAMVPPDNDKLFSILSMGIGVSEPVVRTTSIGTTPGAAFATDLTTTPYNQRTDAFTQEITIRNLDANTPAQNLCFAPIPWSSAGSTCQLKCAAVTITCTKATTDGIWVAPGQTYQRRYDGTSCICVVGSAATTFYQSERVVR